jgi:hypothetical protein
VVERRRVIEAPADRVWSLLSSPEAWSLMPASFAFDVVPSGASQLRVVIVLRQDGPACVLYEVSGDLAGQVMSLTSLPSGQVRLRLSAEPVNRGTRAILTASTQPARRSVDGDIRAFWQVRLDILLANLEAVFQGSRPWPEAAMDPGLNAACRPREPLVSPAEVSASTLIDAPAGVVWDAIHSAGSQALADPERFVCAGQVPGTPVGQPGEMQYFVTRDDQGRLSSSAVVVTELNAPHSALTAVVAPSRIDILHQVKSTQGGTELTLTCRSPARKKGQAVVRQRIADDLQASLDRYKMVIETAGRGPFPSGNGAPVADA